MEPNNLLNDLLDHACFLVEFKENGFVSTRPEPNCHNLLLHTGVDAAKSRLMRFFNKGLCDLLRAGELFEFITLVGTFQPLLNVVDDDFFDDYFECFENCEVVISDYERAKMLSSKLDARKSELASKAEDFYSHPKAKDLYSDLESVRNVLSGKSPVDKVKEKDEVKRPRNKILKSKKKIKKYLSDPELMDRIFDLKVTKESISVLERDLKKLREKGSTEERIAEVEKKIFDLKGIFEQLEGFEHISSSAGRTTTKKCV